MEKQTVSLEGQRLYVGIDVHTKQWSVSIFTQELHHKTFSQPRSPGAMKSYLDQYFPKASVEIPLSRISFFRLKVTTFIN